MLRSEYLLRSKLEQLMDAETDKTTDALDADYVIECADEILRFYNESDYQISKDIKQQNIERLFYVKAKSNKNFKTVLIAAVIITVIISLVTTFTIAKRSKISDELSIHIGSNTERTSVYIWFEDLDLEKIYDDVYREIGYTQEDLDDMDAKLPKYTGADDDEEAFAAYQNEVRDAEKEIQKMQNRLIAATRNAEKESYSKYNNERLEKLNINSDNISYVSKFSPMVIVEVTPEEIRNLEKNELVVSLEYKVTDPPTAETIAE